MRIVFDLHGVIIDPGSIDSIKQDLARDLYGIKFPFHGITKEEIISGKLLTADQYREVEIITYSHPEKAMLMKPAEGFLEYFPKFKQAGHKMFIVTSVTGIMLENAKEWMSRHGIKIPTTGIGRNVNRTDIIQKLRADAYIDDRADNLLAIRKEGLKLFLMSWPSNENTKLPRGILRVADWKDLYEKLVK